MAMMAGEPNGFPSLAHCGAANVQASLALFYETEIVSRPEGLDVGLSMIHLFDSPTIHVFDDRKPFISWAR